MPSNKFIDSAAASMLRSWAALLPAAPAYTCDAGLQVGVVRQIETAAIKKTSENRNTPFTRELTAVYTRATLEVGMLGKGQPLQATTPHRRRIGAAACQQSMLRCTCIPAQRDSTAVSQSPGSGTWPSSHTGEVQALPALQPQQWPC